MWLAWWMHKNALYVKKLSKNICIWCCVLPSQVCMLCSVGYHLFSCHRSEKTCRRWLALDYAGISVGILGCYVPGIFYAFYCNAVSTNISIRLLANSFSFKIWNWRSSGSYCAVFYIVCYFPWLQFWRQVYLLTVLSLILAVFSAQVHPRYLSNDWRWIRMSIFCCVAGVGTIPACHWVWLNGGFTSDVVQVRKQSLCAVCSLYRFRTLLQAVSAVMLLLWF